MICSSTAMLHHKDTDRLLHEGLGTMPQMKNNAPHKTVIGLEH